MAKVTPREFTMKGSVGLSVGIQRKNFEKVDRERVLDVLTEASREHLTGLAPPGWNLEVTRVGVDLKEYEEALTYAFEQGHDTALVVPLRYIVYYTISRPFCLDGPSESYEI